MKPWTIWRAPVDRVADVRRQMRGIASALTVGCCLSWGWVAHAQPRSVPTVTTLAPLPSDWAPAQLPRSVSFDMTSRHTGQRYRILIGLPHPPAASYPVLWALDGLATFPLLDFWRPRPTAEAENPRWRRKVGAEPSGLIVAVGYASGAPMDVDGRAQDYTPATTAPTGDQLSQRHGGAAAYLRFLTEELRPLLARHFPMDPQRHTLFGFSYGGLFALQTLSTEPQHFQRYWAASPSLWFGQHQVLRELPQHLDALRRVSAPLRVVITVGQDEQFPPRFASPERQQMLQDRAMVDNATEFARLLARAEPMLQVQLLRVADHDHHDMLLHGTRRVIDFAFAP